MSKPKGTRSQCFMGALGGLSPFTVVGADATPSHRMNPPDPFKSAYKSQCWTVCGSVPATVRCTVHPRRLLHCHDLADTSEFHTPLGRHEHSSVDG